MSCALPCPALLLCRGMPRVNAKAKDSEWVRQRKAWEASKPADVNEVLLVSPDGLLLEGLTSNFFVLSADGAMQTADEGVLSGTVRELVLQVGEARWIHRICHAPGHLPDVLGGAVVRLCADCMLHLNPGVGGFTLLNGCCANVLCRCVRSRVCRCSCSRRACQTLTAGRGPSSAARRACCCRRARCSTPTKQDSQAKRLVLLRSCQLGRAGAGTRVTLFWAAFLLDVACHVAHGSPVIIGPNATLGKLHWFF